MSSVLDAVEAYKFQEDINLTDDELAYLNGTDSSIKHNNTILEVVKNSGRSLQEEDVYAEICNYFCNNLLKSYNTQNIIEAWRLYKLDHNV